MIILNPDQAIPYGTAGQAIYSVGRRYVNEILLDAGAEYDNITFHFSHKVLSQTILLSSVRLRVWLVARAGRPEDAGADVRAAGGGRGGGEACGCAARPCHRLRRSFLRSEERDDETAAIQLQSGTQLKLRWVRATLGLDGI